MNQIYPDAGLIILATRMVTPSWRYHLFTNNITPDRDTVLGGLTEMAIAGYAAVTVPLASFTLSGVTGHVATLLAAPISFLNSSGGAANAYGYYVTDAANAVLFAVARFNPAPISKADGESWLVTPILGDLSVLSS